MPSHLAKAICSRLGESDLITSNRRVRDLASGVANVRPNLFTRGGKPGIARWQGIGGGAVRSRRGLTIPRFSSGPTGQPGRTTAGQLMSGPGYSITAFRMSRRSTVPGQPSLGPFLGRATVPGVLNIGPGYCAGAAHSWAGLLCQGCSILDRATVPGQLILRPGYCAGATHS